MQKRNHDEHSKESFKNVDFQKIFNTTILILIILILFSLFFIIQSLNENAETIQHINQQIDNISKGMNF